MKNRHNHTINADGNWQPKFSNISVGRKCRVAAGYFSQQYLENKGMIINGNFDLAK